ncbi:hypothetical protein VNI00_011691 [Paramarasmius palmivorus]|uniref:Uncharacterized protein n=1 Tax=Paramarasmius palmivorus TaxID=297713 RepID=A0AAW0CCI6_9AGAR
MGTPDFTDPFANNRPLKRLPRISQKEFKPLAKRVIKSFSRERFRARVGSDENKPDISVSPRPTKVAKRQKFVAAKPLVMTPNRNQNKAPAESFLDLSPHETSGMSSAEQRMLRLMKVLFSDVEYAEVKRERDESELPARPTCVPRRKTDGSILSTDTTPSETITV